MLVRGSRCALCVRIDGALKQLQFVKSEGTISYIVAPERYLAKYVRLAAYVSDKNTVLRVTQQATLGAIIAAKYHTFKENRGKALSAQWPFDRPIQWVVLVTKNTALSGFTYKTGENSGFGQKS